MKSRNSRQSNNFRGKDGSSWSRQRIDSKNRVNNRSNKNSLDGSEKKENPYKFNSNMRGNSNSNYSSRRNSSLSNKRINRNEKYHQPISPYDASNNNSNRIYNNNYRESELSYANNPSNQSYDIKGVSYNDNQNNERIKEKGKELVWGRHSSLSVLEVGRPILRVWCTSEIRNSTKFFQYLKDLKSSGVLVEEVSWARLAQITDGGVHQGIALQPSAAETLSLNKLIDGCSSLEEAPLLLALDGITDPHNLGAIVRSAESLGAHGLILPQRRSAGLTGTVAKVAAGALEHLPVARVVNLNRSLDQLKKVGYTVIGLAEEGSLTLAEGDFTGPIVVVIGSEEKGISLVTRKYCDQLLRIPLRGVTTSLNASVATSVLLYEVARVGWMKKVSGHSPSPRLIRANFSSSKQSRKSNEV